MKATIAVLTGMLCSLNVSANDQWKFGVGVGVISQKSPYKDVGTETNPFPVIYAQKGNFSLLGNQAEYQFYGNEILQFKVLGQYRLEGYEAGDSNYLTDMDEREGALELGLGASFNTPSGTWSTSILTDVSSTHEGYELALGWEKPFQLSPKWMIKPSAELSWRSSDLNNYYYGVKSNEATANRAAYSADSGMMYSAGVDALYFIDKQQTVQLGLGITSWDNEIDDSPLVERSSTPEVKAAYTFRF